MEAFKVQFKTSPTHWPQMLYTPPPPHNDHIRLPNRGIFEVEIQCRRLCYSARPYSVKTYT